MCKLDSIEHLISKIKKEYKYLKLLLVVSDMACEKYKTQIEIICDSSYAYDIISFPNAVVNSELAQNLVKNKITDEVKLIVVIGEHNLFEIVSSCSNSNLCLIPTSPSIFNYKYKAKLLVLDNEVINNNGRKIFANYFAELCSLFCYVIEEVFNKSIYEVQLNSKQTLLIEEQLNKILLMPSCVILSKFGKKMLNEIGYNISGLINYEELKNSVLNKLTTNIVLDNKYKGLLNGEALILSANILLNVFGFVFEAKELNSEIGFNYYSRMLNLRSYNKNIKTSLIANNFANYNNNAKDIAIKYYQIKQNFYSVIELYNQKFSKIFNIFLNLQFDKGLSFKKYLYKDVVISSFNKLPEQSNSASIATFVREFGLLNKF